ncbi:MAG: thermonuclease family protein [Patescibacteria group bacterium]
MKNQSVNILLTGAIVIALLMIFQQPGVQRSLVYYLGLESNYISASNKNSSHNDTEFEVGRVNRVIDGDTMVLDDGRVIRYLNVDTPETKKPNTLVQCYGVQAASYNYQLVYNKQVVLVSDKEDQDRYGRYLRFVFLKGRDYSKIENSVNAILVREGLGRAQIINPNNAFENKFTEIQESAKLAGKGVWGGCEKPFEE